MTDPPLPPEVRPERATRARSVRSSRTAADLGAAADDAATARDPARQTLTHPVAMIGAMEPATTTRFALAARVLAQAARGLGLRAPSFRSPPRLVGADRTLLTRAGRPTVAVRVRGRAWVPVLSDMVEGVVAANGLVGPPADRARDALWRAVAPELAAEARAGPEPRRVA